MSHQFMDFIFTHWVNALTLQAFVKNLSAAVSLLLLLREPLSMAQSLAGHTGISRQSMFHYGF